MILVKNFRKNAAITVLTMLVVLVNFSIFISHLKYRVAIQLVSKIQVLDSKNSGNCCLLYNVQLTLQLLTGMQGVAPFTCTD